MSDSMTVFDRRLVRLHRERAAAGYAAHGFLINEVAQRLAERLHDVTRPFPRVLDLGCHDGALAAAVGGRAGGEAWLQCDASLGMARRAAGNGRFTLVADEEYLPFAAGAFDLALSNLSLHWVNDLPGCLLQIRRSLKPDGLFLAAMLGGATLAELGDVLMAAELAETGGASPRLSPFAELRDAGALLQRAGFALPVVDSDSITVTYADIMALMRDLRGMGEANAVLSRRNAFTRRSILARADALYRQRHADAEGRLVATFQVIYLTGWAPHQSQQQALRPGSAKTKLAAALGSEEIPAGEKAGGP